MVATLVVTLLPCFSKTQRTIILICIEYEYVALLSYVQDVKFFNMLLQEISEVQKPENLHEYNQGAIFLANNIQVVICTKYINIRHHFLREIFKKIICISSTLGMKKTP